MYQPKIKDELIRKLYAAAKVQNKPMTKLLNEIVEEAVIAYQLLPYEERRIRIEANPNTLKRKMQEFEKLMREYHGEANGTQPHEREEETRREADVPALAESPPDSQDSV